MRFAATFRKQVPVVVFSVLALLACQARAEISPDSETESKPVKLASMLASAFSSENKGTLDGYWEAASLYCKASRLGDLEAQYRLGMLYAFGKGVPENRTFAATLFAIASRQGHHEAMNMLETINFHSDAPPPCVLEDVAPEKAPYPPAFSDDKGDGQINEYLAALPESKKWILSLVEQTAQWHEIDPKLVLSIIAIESGFKTGAKSHANALGLMQLIPATADRFNVKNAFDAVQNIKGGIRYLEWLLSYYRGNVDLVAAAYNAGEGAVDKHRGVPPYRETKDYLKKLRVLYKKSFHPFKEGIGRKSPIS